MNDRQIANGKWLKYMANSSWLIALIFIISSCSTHKDLSSIRMMSANHIIREVDDSSFEFDNLQAKFDVIFKDKHNGGNVGLKGQLRMQNDSVIWVSISLKLGVELARVMITDDSIKFINRTDKTYFTIGTDCLDSILLNQKSPIDNPLRWIQDMLTGNITLTNDGRYHVAIENDKYKLATRNNSRNEALLDNNNVFVNPETFKVSRYEIITCLPTGNPDDEEWHCYLQMGLDYDNFKNINGKLIPAEITFEYTSFSGIIEIDYTEIKIGEKPEFPFNISKKYARINL